MLVTSGGATATPKPADNVTLCHRTDSETNPYRVETVDPAIAHKAHLDHTGTVWFPGHPKEPKWGDIIPPFTYLGNVFSLNWDAAGMAIWNNGCQPVSESTSPSTTTTTTAPSTSPSTTTTSTTPSTSSTTSLATSPVVTSKPPSTSGSGTIPQSVNAGLHTVTSSAARLWGVVLLLSAGLIGLITAFWPATGRRHG